MLIPWEQVPDLLDCINDAMKYNAQGYEQEKRRRIDRSAAALARWKDDYERTRQFGNMLVDAYKEKNPEAQVRYAKPLEGG